MNSLPGDVSEHRLRRELDRYGPVVKTKLIHEATNSKKTTLGIVYLDKRGDGARAVEYLNQAYFFILPFYGLRGDNCDDDDVDQLQALVERVADDS